MDSQPVPDPGAGQILVKAKWLSVDPCARPHESSHQLYEGDTVSDQFEGYLRSTHCPEGLLQKLSCDGRCTKAED